MLLKIVFIVIAIFLIIMTLLQSGKGDGINSIFTGGDGLNLFAHVKERGVEKTVSRFTMFLGLLFMAVALLIHVYR